MLIRTSDYKLVNGFPSVIYGWGREDSEFGYRLLDVGLQLTSIPVPSKGQQRWEHWHTQHWLHLHNDSERPRLHSVDDKRALTAMEIGCHRRSGLNDTVYELVLKKNGFVEVGAPYFDPACFHKIHGMNFFLCVIAPQ